MYTNTATPRKGEYGEGKPRHLSPPSAPTRQGSRWQRPTCQSRDGSIRSDWSGMILNNSSEMSGVPAVRECADSVPDMGFA